MTTPYVSSGPMNEDALLTGPVMEQNPDNQPADGQQTPNPPDMLGMQEAAAAKRNVAIFNAQQPLMRHRLAQWRVNALRRRGFSNVKLVKDQDTDRWICWAPPSNIAAAPVANKAATICRRLTSILLADPPVPEPVPPSGEEADRDAAELAGRILVEVQGDAGTREVKLMRRAGDRASTYGSGFVHYWLDRDPQRTVPKAVEVSATATNLNTAVLPDGTPAGPPPYIRKYVMSDGTLSDDPTGAVAVPVNRICARVLTGKNVRFLPHTAEDIWDAEGIQLGEFLAWGDVKRRFPGLADRLTDEQLKTMKGYRPPENLDLLPHREGLTPIIRDSEAPGEGTIQDEDLVWSVTTYYRAGEAYPEGCYLVSLGENVVAYRSTWMGTIDGRPEALEIPVTQYMQFDEGEVANGYKVALMTLLGPANEVAQAQLGAILEHIDKFTNRRVFIPSNSILQKKDLMQATGTPITINPGGEPKYEDVPEPPQILLNVFDRMQGTMTDDSGLQQAAQGVQDPSVTSGKQASIIVSQVMSGLSDLKENYVEGYLRACRIQLQLIRAGFDVPQMISYVGNDGSFRVKEFTGDSLRKTRDVRLKIGSMSMMNPLQKTELATSYLQLGVLDTDRLRQIIADNLGGTLGLEDAPERLRVRRQIAEWMDGPPKGYEAPAPQVTGVSAGGTAPQTQPQPAPDAVAIFAPVAADDQPDIAKLRAFELGRAMCTVQYQRWPTEWRLAFDNEYQRARQAAGIMTLAEQSQAQQAAADAQRQAQMDVAAIQKSGAASGQPDTIKPNTAAPSPAPSGPAGAPAAPPTAGTPS